MNSLISLLLPALALATPIERRQEASTTPSADQIIIQSVSTSGTGCPQGSVSTTLDTTGTVVTFGFDSFLALIGPQAAQADKSKACQLHLDLHYPGGFQYAVVDAVYHGYARLDPGVTGTFLSTYYFSQNAAQTTTTRSTISGKEWIDGNVYTKEDQVPSTAVIWSPCGASGILNVNNRISLAVASNAKNATGELSDDDATVSFDQQLHVSWQPCNGGSTGGGTFTTGGSATAFIPREAEAEADAEPQDFTLYPGTTVVTAGPTGDTSGTTLTPGKPGGGTTIVKPGKKE